MDCKPIHLTFMSVNIDINFTHAKQTLDMYFMELSFTFNCTQAVLL